MSDEIRPLRGLRSSDAGEVGGKAASLGELLSAGVQVPDGFVVPSVDGRNGDDDHVRSIREALAGMGVGPFAVRSSGIAEDGAEQSYAGIFESILDVAPADVPDAVERVASSAAEARVAGYGGDDTRMAVIVQRMIRAQAAGVALTADPISGDRASCIVTAVRGLGDRLVSGTAAGDEWVVRDGRASAVRRPEAAIDAKQAKAIADEARRIAAARGGPQDVEWAIDAGGELWILQARPMTGLPPDVPWECPAPGAFTRQLRFGEWISEPVTPLFESWLLTRMEIRLHEQLREWTGQAAPLPHHVLVNGWYFYSLNWLSPGASIRYMPSLLWHAIRRPRRVAGMFPPTVRYSISTFERDWRDDLQPRYRASIADAATSLETTPPSDLPAVIDRLADLAGEYFASVATVAGAAYKMEMNLAIFYRRHLAKKIGGSHLPLVAGFGLPADPGRHAISSLDWWFEPSPYPDARTPHPERIVDARRAAENAAFDALAANPRRLRSFRRLLHQTQRLVPIREEQVQELTIAWPVMRGAVVRIGEELAARGALSTADDVFFLTRAEAIAALGGAAPVAIDVADRRTRRDEQARLVPPLLVGHLNPILRRIWDAFPKLVGAVRSERAIVAGSPASPGRATGLVRVIRGPDAFDSLQAGEILVAPMTAPAWTPLFTRAAAVVTDVGSAAAHASIIAREYGIPAVVGCGDATARLRTGTRVTVDGTTGNVELA
jgi:phosphohistidine swiveling domain-containing protein